MKTTSPESLVPSPASKLAVALATIGQQLDVVARELPAVATREETRDAVAHLDRLITIAVDQSVAARQRADLKPSDFKR